MRADRDRPLTVSGRRRARRLAYWNGVLWAVGNGLASTTLVIYLALELGAGRIGLGIALILAVRHVVGLLRLGAPAVIGRLADRKRFCVGAFLASILLLWALPAAAAPQWSRSSNASLAALVVLWCLYHLLQYVGMVAFWSWLADLVPLRIRGRFLGRRQRWLVVGEAAGTLSSALFVWGWQHLNPGQPEWMAYVIPAVVGGAFMIAALLPLVLMPPAARGGAIRRGDTLQSMLAPFSDGRFLRLVLFGCWFSLSNGLTQTAQYSYPKHVLLAAYPEQLAGMVLFVMLTVQTGMRLGQLTISPWMGRLADRFGNRAVMIGSLLLVAQGLLFYFLSTPQHCWWFVGAWVLWIAYAGLNVCLPNLMLKLSPGESNTPYIAMFYAVTGLCYAANTIVGGVLYDRYRADTFTFFGRLSLGYYQSIFLLGWIARSLGVVVLVLLVVEGRGQGADSCQGSAVD